MDFVWSRTYRSRAGSNTAQGNNWDMSYNVRLAATTFGVDRALLR